MRGPARILIISSCTGTKVAPAVLAEADFSDDARLKRAIQQHRKAVVAAERLYAGQHHMRLMRGVQRARAAAHLAVDLRLVSAGFGLVRGDELLPPYERTFVGRRRDERRALADAARIPQTVAECLTTEYD